MEFFFLEPGATWLWRLIFFSNDADIKIISEFKDSFGKNYPVFQKNPKNWVVKVPVFDSNFRGESAIKGA